jgi:lipopolysaccharide transport system ATP-binding protein
VEIKRKFDEIVDFAEVETFLDTPVKRYSSGMYVRLAFAVAAHLEPEILIIDEVLAVGDVSFQRKCLGKMRDVALEGRTVVFVSHNLAAIVALTNRSLLIDKGRLLMMGRSNDVVSSLLQRMNEEIQEMGDVSAYRRSHRTAGYAEIAWIKICGREPGDVSICLWDSLNLEIGVTIFQTLEQGILVINILNEQLEVLTSLTSTDSGFEFPLAPGTHVISCDVAHLPLMPGYYRLSVGIAESSGVLAWDVVEPIPGFRVEVTDKSGRIHTMNRPGVILMNNCQWASRAAKSLDPSCSV